MTPAAGADLEIARLLGVIRAPGEQSAAGQAGTGRGSGRPVLHPARQTFADLRRDSGVPPAREVERATAGSPETNVLVLGNHGLVVCGDDCEAAERLLQEVESRVAIEPRPTPEPD